MWVNFINIAVAMQNWNNIGPNVYVSTAAMTHWNYLTTIATISKGLLNKNCCSPSCCIIELAMLCSMMKRNISCLTNPCWWLQLQSSNFNVSLAWFLNLFSIKFWFQAYQMYKPQIGNFSEKLLRMRAPVFFQNKNFLIELLQTHTLIF